MPAANFDCTSVFSNTSARIADRGPWQFESVARELMLDIAARDMDLDPAELRRRNLLRTDEFPTANAIGMPFTMSTPLETFEEALEILDYDAFCKEQAAARAEGRYIGVGRCRASAARSWNHAYDKDGNPVATTFMDYLLPTSTEVPVIEYGHVGPPAPAATRASVRADHDAGGRRSARRAGRRDQGHRGRAEPGRDARAAARRVRPPRRPRPNRGAARRRAA